MKQVQFIYGSSGEPWDKFALRVNTVLNILGDNVIAVLPASHNKGDAGNIFVVTIVTDDKLSTP